MRPINRAKDIRNIARAQAVLTGCRAWPYSLSSEGLKPFRSARAALILRLRIDSGDTLTSCINLGLTSWLTEVQELTRHSVFFTHRLTIA